MTKKQIPKTTATRLAIYYRILTESQRPEFISSEELAYYSGFSAAQVRKDLAYFGRFGIPGRGYRKDNLKDEIIKILGLDHKWNVALIGAGNLGSALLSYKAFSEHGFDIVATFDNNKRKIGKNCRGFVVQDIKKIKSIAKKREISMAIIAVPAQAAQEVTDIVIDAGIKAILNFAPANLSVPTGISLLNIDMSIELQRLSYLVMYRRRLKE
jgi:redox-sensing transcriptional repressor